MDRSLRIATGLAALSFVLSGAGCKDELPLLPDKDAPASRPADPATAPALDGALLIRATPAAPHDGRLLPIASDVGYVEWVLDSENATARLYFLTTDLRPLPLAAPPSLILVGPAGPHEVPLEPLAPTDTEPGFKARSDLLRRPLPEGLIRIRVGLEGYRILLPARLAETAPAERAELEPDPGEAP